jgi:predicted nucleotide-binding protein
MLQVSVPIAYELFAQCIKQGQALVQRASLVGDFSDYESWKSARNQWVEPTMQALEHMYGGRSQAGEFAEAAATTDGNKRWQQQYAVDLDAVKAAIDFLTVLQSELAFAREDVGGELGAAVGAGELTAAGAKGERETDDAPQPEPATAPRPAPSAAPESESESAQVAVVVEPDRAATPEPVAVAKHQPEPEPPARERDREREPPPKDEPRSDDEHAADRAQLSAELAPAPRVGAELAQHANGAVSAERAGAPGAAPSASKHVLLAHGRNERWKQAVAQLLERAGTHEITILNERASERASERGALADQFGEHMPGSRYAVVLLTADDIAAPRVDSEDEPYFSPRAHQAVVFEMGFLVAALSPGRVCVLYEEGVQLPCDLDGIAYVRLDLAGTWQPKLLLQLRKAGFDYDLNKLAAA